MDVGGSMARYADAVLRFAHAAARGSRTERAMAALTAAAVPDRPGGTRLCELPRELSNGWERGDQELPAGRMRRLHRPAYRVTWATPLMAPRLRACGRAGTSGAGGERSRRCVTSSRC
ncbi:hypothetical protein [Streptomyces sviceus]|uniref:hypothetical protein n=1 Tax=Streptomyces sviceus TaxID=285530 RepID=UPI00368D78A8